ncbi:thermostable hemolysin [Bowmanella denitrificans]|uniref:Thermostable hemolysin n=1 Tax=Bowmanella denitrificans TaxID=366582 RepID=A0ABN0XNR4_9ALTE
MYQQVLQYCGDIARHASVNPGQGLSLSCARPSSPSRGQLEAFIHQGFAKAYGADIHHFMPMLLAIKGQQYQAALGLRSGRSPLFIQQYLSSDLLDCLAQKGIYTQPERVAEVGNLYGLSRRYTLPLFMAMAVGLYLNHYTHLLFCGTHHLIALLAKEGVKLTYLTDAYSARLAPSNDDWGSYYQTQPQVMALDLNDAMLPMLERDLLPGLFASFCADIQLLSNELRAL